MNKEKYQESLNDIIKNCNGFPCKNDSFYNMQELIDNRYMEYLLLLEKHNRLNNVINELSDFVIKIYKKEMNKTSDWWLQEELCTSFDDINLATNFRLEKELKEEK